MSKSVYFLHRTQVKDFDRYAKDYAQHAVELVMHHGGKVLAATSEPTKLEGEWSGNWTAIMQFPSKTDAMGFYNSPRYAPFKTKRIEEFTDGGEFLMLPAFDATVLNRALKS